LCNENKHKRIKLSSSEIRYGYTSARDRDVTTFILHFSHEKFNALMSSQNPPLQYDFFSLLYTREKCELERERGK
jgi:hypothetical protein